MPRCMADQRPELQRLAPQSPPPGREVWLGYHEDMRETPRIRAVANFIADALRRRGDLSDRDLILIILGIAVLVLIIVAVR